jgi:hypothetical protein
MSVIDDVQAYLRDHPDFLKSALGGLPGGGSMADIGNNADALANTPTMQNIARGVSGAPINPVVPNPGNPVSGMAEGAITPLVSDENAPQAPQTPPMAPSPTPSVSAPPSANTPPISAPQSSVTPPSVGLPTSNTPPAPITIDPTEDQRRREAMDAAREHARRMSVLAGAAGGIGDAIATSAQAFGVKGPANAQDEIAQQAQDKYTNTGTEFETKLKQDPNSDISKSYRAMVQQISPQVAQNPAFATMSAQDIGDKLPLIDTMMKAQAQKDSQKLALESAQAIRENTQEIQRQNRSDTAVNQGIARIAGVRGDASLARSELQRDAAATAVNRIDEVTANGQQLTPFDYTDILGQLYKARSGQAPGEQVMKEIRQPTGSAAFNHAWTFLTGQQSPGTTASITASLRNAAASMGKQADEFHDGYMQSHLVKPAGVSDESWAPVAATSRGTSFADNVAKHQAALKANKPQVAPSTSAATNNDPLGIR